MPSSGVRPAPRLPSVIDVEDVEAVDFVREYVNPGRPVLIRGAMEEWKAPEAWQDLDYLVEAAAERLVWAKNVDSGSPSRIPLKQFWRSIFAGGNVPLDYIIAIMTEHGTDGVLGHLKQNVAAGPYFPSAALVSTLVFAGRNSRCALHYHPTTEAYLCQVVGKKRVLLCPPEQTRRLYPIEWYSSHVSFSKVAFGRDGGWPELARFPELAETRPLDCTVEPKNMLYIPIYWWHVVFGEELSMCVTHMYRAAFRKRFLTRMGLRSNYLNGKVLRHHRNLFGRAWEEQA